MEFGEDYALQRREGDAWKDLTFRENAAFNAIGYALEPGGTMALTCGFDLFKEMPETGTYRLVKTVGGQTLYAEFELGDSPYTAETPYGFIPLEDLPEMPELSGEGQMRLNEDGQIVDPVEAAEITGADTPENAAFPESGTEVSEE